MVTLPVEPAEHDADSVLVLLRSPIHTVYQRRFRHSDTVQVRSGYRGKCLFFILFCFENVSSVMRCFARFVPAPLFCTCPMSVLASPLCLSHSSPCRKSTLTVTKNSVDNKQKPRPPCVLITQSKSCASWLGRTDRLARGLTSQRINCQRAHVVVVPVSVATQGV